MWRDNPYLRFGPGAEPVAWAALILASLLLALVSSKYCARLLARFSTTQLLVLSSSAAALLSWGYVVHYLRGGPRIVDAAHYFLQGRALAQGFFAFPVPEPTASFNGRFLLANAGGDSLAVLFPPGYPALLALAFLAGAPLLLGPLLAAALVVLSYALARELGASQNGALTAAGLSLLSAALRYHTADTMSHGLAAALVAASALGTLRGSRFALGAAGVAAGWLIATRPVTGVVVLGCAFVFTLREARWPARLPWLLLGVLPGALLLFVEQSTVSGHVFGLSQAEYYARADGPPGCFRYGFGAGLGCLFEHGDYVRARLPHGYGVAEALATTGRRLLVHSIDIANAAPLALGVPLGVWLGRGERRNAFISILLLGIVVGYAPFYFEASYPGGGARLFCDALPLEHVLLARALSALRLARFAWPVALLGFGLHANSQHVALREREGGHPMFEPERLRAAKVDRGLVFVNTDHGFALGHEPGRRSAADGIVVARERGDALDVLLWQGLGRPPSYRYHYDASAERRGATIAPWLPRSPLGPENRRIEAESLWPPVSVAGGWAHPDFPAEACASRGRALRVHSLGGTTELALAIPDPGPNHVFAIGWIGVPPTVEVRENTDGTAPSWLRLSWKSDGSGCWQSLPARGPHHKHAGTITVRVGSGLIDYIEWRKSPTEKGVDN